MKKKRIKLLLIPLFIFLAACIYFRIYYTRTHVRNVELDYGKPQFYTLEEVKAAGDAVIEDFKACPGFNGCQMNRLYYDEETSEKASIQDKKDEIRFDVYYKTGLFPPLNDSALTENSWGWWLERKSPNDPWIIVNKGEG